MLTRIKQRFTQKKTKQTNNKLIQNISLFYTHSRDEKKQHTQQQNQQKTITLNLMLFKKKTREKLISAMNTLSDNSFWNLLLANKEEILKKHFEYRKFCDVLLGEMKKKNT